MARTLLLPPLPVSSSPALAVLAKGFRPFFLLAATYAVVIVPLWLAVLHGFTAPSSYWTAVTWHAHEMLHGFAIAVVAGFLLTAVGNWTERETATGAALALLALLWCAGRVAVLAAGALPRGVPALIDLAFLPALMVTLARPLFATSNRRNFAMLAVLAMLFAANTVTHLDALGIWRGAARNAQLFSVDLLALLISIIAGRVIPMFTRNATGVAAIRSVPWLDKSSIGTMLLLCGLDAAGARDSALTTVVAGAAGVLAAARARSWGAGHVRRDPLLWILHLGYGWLVLGFLLRGASLVADMPFAAMSTHALTLGAVGSLTLGMMARVALGHTGRMLVAPAPLAAAFVAITLASAFRVLAPCLPAAWYLTTLVAAGAFWTLAFAVYLGVYAPMLLLPRVDRKRG